jgi:hypothetical protein
MLNQFKITLLLNCIVFFLITLIGCQSSDNSSEKINEKSEFPTFMVGTWGTYGKIWTFTFTPDGNVSSFVHGLDVQVDENNLFIENEGTDGAKETYVFEPCEVEYNQEQRELRVVVNLEYFKIELPIGEIEGKSRDVFVGKISEDGTTWNAKWWSYNQIEGGEAKGETADKNAYPLDFIKTMK